MERKKSKVNEVLCIYMRWSGKAFCYRDIWWDTWRSKEVGAPDIWMRRKHCREDDGMCRGPATTKSLQSCPTPCDPIDGSPPGSPIPGILQARTLEWVASSFSNAWKWKVKVKSLSRVRLLATPWTAAHQAPPSLGFSRREYWSGVPLVWENAVR